MNAKVFRLSGAINPRGRGPAVCVPVFTCVADNYLYAQRIGIDHNVLAFELADLSEDEQIRGAFKARTLREDDPAIFWISLSDDLENSVSGDIEIVRPAIIENRWLVDKVRNSFERLDLAQLSGQYTWFAAEAKACAAAFDGPAREYWLSETLLLNRVRFAVDSILFSAEVPSPARRRVTMGIRGGDRSAVLQQVELLCQQHVPAGSRSTMVAAVERFLNRDVAYRFAMEALSGSVDKRSPSVPAARWYKKITRSDAQRKRSGNQRGGITLVKGPFEVSTQTYFRKDLFAGLDWVAGKTKTTNKALETASVPMRTRVLGRRLETRSFSLSYASNRVAGQNNYTTLLHLGPLSPVFARRDMTGNWLLIERAEDGIFSLTITEERPA